MVSSLWDVTVAIHLYNKQHVSESPTATNPQAPRNPAVPPSIKHVLLNRQPPAIRRTSSSSPGTPSSQPATNTNVPRTPQPPTTSLQKPTSSRDGIAQDQRLRYRRQPVLLLLSTTTTTTSRLRTPHAMSPFPNPTSPRICQDRIIAPESSSRAQGFRETVS